MGCYIIIRGPAGVGKTTVAKKLASRLSACIVFLDEIMANHRLDTVIGDGISAENFIRGNEIILKEVKSILEKDGTVIIDACFYRKGHIDHLIKSLPYRHFIFTLKASVRECIKRNEGRIKPMSKQDIIDVHKLVSGHEVGIPIDTEEKTADDVAEGILAYIQK
ncbi:MAG: ATP-binding protein [Candidatus Aenigmarchaeota archaeon]|nr:ATP-binding protein [Candidatus Aenigmarchaeota archaeon]